MDYYRRFPGDYLRDTLGLTLAEDGAYSRLLDFQYTTERPIRNEEEAYRVSRASTKRERKVVQKILHMFFHLTESGWSNPRVVKEISYAESKRSKAKASAEARWRPDANAMRTHSEGNAISDNQTVRQEDKYKVKISRAKPALSENFEIFWNAYPRREGKQAAVKVWNRLGLEEKLGEILAGLEAWKKAREPQYMPYAQGWLNSKSWMDAPLIGVGKISKTREKARNTNEALERLKQRLDSGVAEETSGPFRGRTN